MPTSSAALILRFDKDRHKAGLRECVIELQDFERRVDPRMPSGTEIADPYLADMFDRCEECGGRVLIAEVDGDVAGYTTILPKVKSEQIEDGDIEYGLISDLVVLERYRRLGLGRKLLESAQLYARTCKVRYLRIGVLSGNPIAEDLYAAAGFSPLYVELEKVLDGS